jgi:hypothetical protein
MQKVSFKKFSTFVDLPEDPTADQLQEIFGIFGGNKEKVDKLQAQRAKLKAAELAKRKEIAKQKDKIWADKAAELAGKSKKEPNPLDRLQTNQMRAGQLRAVDRNPFGTND